MSEAFCGLCGQNKEAHREMAHKFSISGQLEAKETEKPPTTPRTSADHVLRLLLMEAGVITAEQMTAMEVKVHESARADTPR